MNKFKRLLAGVLSAALALTLAACGAAKPEDTVKTSLDALIAGDLKTATAAFDTNGQDTLNDDDKEFQDVAKAIFSKMTYSVKETKVDGDTATVKAEIQAADMEAVMQSVVQELMQLALSNPNMSEDEMTAKTAELLTNGVKSATEKKTSTVDITLKKAGEKWQIQSSDDLLDALTGGLNSLSDALGGTSK